MTELARGNRLGVFEVGDLLGEGGMGKVYRARDTKLDRDVALKVLPEAFTADPDRLARFEREAKVLASLNHPNIGTIYGLEEAEGVRALVLELVEGPTLADRIKQGPIPIDDALGIARQIAEALEAAHEQGVIHRDLKPANIKVRADGAVKVLDFGLAKALDPAPEVAPDQSPTLTAAATQMGVILGTAAYMSPEQASGQTVDKRSDIWAFGVVLYEMLSGERLFAGETVSHVIAEILARDADLDRLSPQIPASVMRLLRRCVTRDRKRRLPDIGVARLDLGDAMVDPAASLTADLTPLHVPAWRRALPWVGGVLVGAVLMGVAPWSPGEPPSNLPLRKLTLPVPGGLTHDDEVAVSPDGQKVAFTRNERLWIHEVSQLEPIEIVDSDGAFRPFWSPDSAFVAYAAGQFLKKVSAEGGRSDIVCAAPAYFMGGSWDDAGTIVFGQDGFGLSAVSEQGGDARVVVALDPAHERLVGFPHHLPDGSLLFGVFAPDDSSEIVVQSGDTRTSLVSLETTFDGLTYSPTGHVLYRRGWPESEGIWAVPFSPSSLARIGEPFRVTDNGVTPSVSSDGTLVYAVFPDTQQLTWVTRSGEIDGILGQPQGRIWEPSVSPDGRYVVAQGHERGSLDIWRYDVARGTRDRLTLDRGAEDEPVWSPAGDRIAFTSARNGTLDIFLKDLAQRGEVEPLVVGPSRDHAPNWSADGRYIAYHTLDADTRNRDLWYVDLDGDRQPIPFLRTDFDELLPQFSPNGEYLAYQSNEQGRWEVFVTRFPSGEGTEPVSANGGVHLRWSPRGDEIFYLEGDTLMAVSVETEPRLRLGEPEPLFDVAELGAYMSPARNVDYPNYNVDVDGQRFIMVRPVESEDTRSQIVFVENWVAQFSPEN